MNKPFILSEQLIVSKIYLVRGKKVMLDADLAALYGVETKRLKEQVRRNPERFPQDFMFTPNFEELKHLRSQIATSSLEENWGGSRYLPMVFTEHGVLMLSSVLNSQQAIAVNIQIMRIFSRFREMMFTNQEIMERLEKLEKTFLYADVRHARLEEEIQLVFATLKQMMEEPDKTIPDKIGFRINKEES
jgi:hypothetical protein